MTNEQIIDSLKEIFTLTVRKDFNGTEYAYDSCVSYAKEIFNSICDVFIIKDLNTKLYRLEMQTGQRPKSATHSLSKKIYNGVEPPYYDCYCLFTATLKEGVTLESAEFILKSLQSKILK